jgi:hypothetical protein
MKEDEPAGEGAPKVDTIEAGKQASGDRPGRLQQLLVEYGAIGIIVLLSISALTYLGFVVAILVGFEVEGSGETAGVFAAAAVGWAATKPIRIPLAVALTPVVAMVWHRVRGKVVAAWHRVRGTTPSPKR